MTVFSARPGAKPEVIIAAGDTYQTPLLPGFELALAELLAAADDWDDVN